MLAISMWCSTLCLLCIIALSLTPAKSQSLKRFRKDQLLSFVKNEIVPDVISHVPKRIVLADFYSGVSAMMGNELTPTQVKVQPILTWPTDPNGFYTVCMIDPDAPSRETPTLREWNHWLVVNIPAKDLKKGEVLVDYVGAGPPYETGFHRYVLLVYKQPSKLTFNETRITKMSAKNRDKFSISNFALKYNMGHALAGNFFKSQFDQYVPLLNMQLGL